MQEVASALKLCMLWDNATVVASLHVLCDDSSLFHVGQHATEQTGNS